MILAALLSDQADICIRGVGLNPTRTGVLDIFLAMGASLAVENERTVGGEPIADIRARASSLQGIDVDERLVSLAIDEFPALFVAAGAATGTTRFTGLAELRVKESDRISSMANGLMALGIEVSETPDGAVVTGGRFCSGTVDSHGDHRVAMSLAVAGTVADGPVTVEDVQPVETSFPGFATLLREIGGEIVVGGADAV
jgi:3-phosphoshikimate 1-carboxyvinyltransferase